MTPSINDNQHNNALYYAECHCGGCCVLFIVVLNIIMLSIVKLKNVTMLNVVAPHFCINVGTKMTLKLS
jgi:hypothetical protein